MGKEQKKTREINEREYLSHFYQLLESGEFKPQQIEVIVVETTLERTEEEQAYIDERWNKFKGKKRDGDKNPSRFRYEGHKVIDGKLIALVSPTVSYKDHIGCDAGFIKKFEMEKSALSISTTTLIKTSDEKVVVTIRGEGSDYKAGGTSFLGGFVEIDKDMESGSVNIIGSALREIKEESGIKPEEISHMSVVGITFDPRSGTVDLGFVAKTSLSSNEIINRKHDDENVVVVIDASSKESVENFIFKFTHAHVGTALAILIEYGNNKFGPKWREGVIRLLRVKGSVYDKKDNAFEKLEEWNVGKVASKLLKVN